MHSVWRKCDLGFGKYDPGFGKYDPGFGKYDPGFGKYDPGFEMAGFVNLDTLNLTGRCLHCWISLFCDKSSALTA